MKLDPLNTFTLRHLPPERMLILSFILMIAVGTSLLYLPQSATAGRASLVDAIFTATSAVCVTGLIVVDTGSFYSLFGQGVILVLIQVGGLGIMTFSVLFYVLLGRSIGFRDRTIIQSTLSHSSMSDLYIVLRSVFFYTIVLEFVGAVLLFSTWRGEFPLVRAAYFSVFHAISAFCNAGFSLFSDSLVGFRGSIPVNLVFAVLIVLGGIGFVVLRETVETGFRRNRTIRLSVHSKIVLTTTVVLIILGALFIFFIEKDNSLLKSSVVEKILISCFQSVTSRTAGFHTISMADLSSATLFVLILLMFVGASPGSCGGGIKTTNLAILVSLALNRYMGRDRADLFRRTIPSETVSRSISIVLIAGVAVIIITVVLLVTQLGGLGHTESRGLFLEYLFETVSAFATVGLSMGVTPRLDVVGKLTIIIMMLLGRLGPLTLGFAMARRVQKAEFHYAEENILVG